MSAIGSYSIIEDLYLTNRNFCSDDYDNVLAYIHRLLPAATILRYENPSVLKGWMIPPKWNLITATISQNDEILLDASNHPLSVIGLSSSFSGEVSGAELKKHLHYKTHFDSIEDDVIPFHFSQFYRPWNRNWGFCVSNVFYKNIKDEEQYVVNIQTEEKDGYLDVLEYTLPGESDLTIVFVAHLDHPGMANDDLAGCAVGIELFHELAKSKKKYTYKLLLVQEIIGSVYYLENLKEEERSKIRAGLFLEMLGTEGELKLQCSNSYNPLESLIVRQFKDKHGNDLSNYVFGFRELIGNDEIVFESFDIPMSSLSRFPYPEYHTSKDNLSIISEKRLKESLVFLTELCGQFEKTTFVERNDLGIYALSNPEYNLYVKPDSSKSANGDLRKLMDYLFFIDSPHSIQDLASRFNLALEVVEPYILECIKRGVLKNSE
jgi:aminopeptidase-like protein